MHNIVELLQNQALWCAVAAWFIAQALKIPTYWLVEKKLDLKIGRASCRERV